MNDMQNKPANTDARSDFFKYESNIYRMRGVGKHKDRATREWYPTVIYEDKNGEIYSRCEKEFYSKFENLKPGVVDGIAWDNQLFIAQLNTKNALDGSS